MKNVVIIVFSLILLSSCAVSNVDRRTPELNNCIKESNVRLNLNPEVQAKYDAAYKRYKKFAKETKKASNKRKSVLKTHANNGGYNPFEEKNANL